MKQLKTVLLTGLLTLGVFSIITYTSCKKDECKGVVCNNEGNCEDGVCACPLGFEGPNCDTKSINKFVGIFNATDNCPAPDTSRSPADLNYTLTITNASDNKTVYVINLANASSDPSDRLIATLTSSTELTIAPQTISDGRTYSGTITYVNSGKLSASFQVKENGTIVEACNSTATK